MYVVIFLILTSDIIRNRGPIHPVIAENEIYVSRSKPISAYVARVEKLLSTSRFKMVVLHGTDKSVEQVEEVTNRLIQTNSKLVARRKKGQSAEYIDLIPKTSGVKAQTCSKMVPAVRVTIRVQQ